MLVRIETDLPAHPALAALVAGSTKTAPYLIRKLHLSAVRRGCPFMQPPPGRSPPTFWLKCSRMHARYFDDNVVFFRVDSIHSPGPGCGSVFLFRSPKAQCKKTMPPPGIVVDADAAVLCLHNFLVTMASPSAAPWLPFPLSRQNRSKICFRCSAGIPGPRSTTLMAAFADNAHCRRAGVSDRVLDKNF